MTSAYLNALYEEGTREDLLREVGRLYDEVEQLRGMKENLVLRTEIERLRKANELLEVSRREIIEINERRMTEIGRLLAALQEIANDYNPVGPH